MPLAILSDTEALANRKQNAGSGWGDRSTANRVEPVALPQFAVPFKLEPGSRIFTIGSCFARNVESELLTRGFSIPVRELFRRPDFQHLDLGVINNYGTPSIYNEIAWAFEERPFEPEHHLVEVVGGKFADIHLSPALRAEPWETVLGRRRAISEAYRMAAQCSVVIMTLGLSELWFDTHSGFYINVAPRPSLIQKFPGRFQLHVLDFAEAYDYLDMAVGILKAHAPGQRIILTVSPVPMMSTHRAMDVMVANTYSKSVLRVAAEALTVKHDFVTYYPSFESVMLSDRKIAWRDDMVHVTPEIVALNVGRMIEAFTDAGDRDADIPDALQALEKAKAARARGPEFATGFFQRHGHWSETNRDFAIEHARHVLNAKAPAEALTVLAPYGDDIATIAILKSEALVALGRPKDAFELLNPMCERWNKSRALWEALMAAALALGDPEIVDAALLRYRGAIPTKVGPACIAAAKWFHARGDKERAGALALAASQAPLMNVHAIDLCELLVELGRLPEAREVLTIVAFPTAMERVKADRLQAFLGAA